MNNPEKIPEELYKKAIEMWVKDKMPTADPESIYTFLMAAEPKVKATFDKVLKEVYIPQILELAEAEEEKRLQEPKPKRAEAELIELEEKKEKILDAYEKALPMMKIRIRDLRDYLYTIAPKKYPKLVPVVEKPREMRLPRVKLPVEPWRGYLIVFKELIEKGQKPTMDEWAKTTWDKYAFVHKERRRSIGGKKFNVGHLHNCLIGRTKEGKPTKDCGGPTPRNKLYTAWESGIIAFAIPKETPLRYGIGPGYSIADLDKLVGVPAGEPEEFEEELEPEEREPERL